MSEQSELDNHKARLSSTQETLLRQRLQRVLATIVHGPSITPRPDLSQFPLSFAQERFWFLHQLAPDSPAYNRPVAFRLHGPLDPAVLQQVLSEIGRRHEVLRASFPTVEGRPTQTIHAPKPVPVPVVDLSVENPQEREGHARTLARRETQRPFDVAQGPLWRARLLRLAADDHVLLLPMHHMISDAWSDRVLLTELVFLYRALAAGRPSPLPELPAQYADWAYWQRQSRQDEAMHGHLSYWTEQLSNLATLELPTDRPRPLEETSRGADQHLALSPALVQAVKALGRQENATPFMVLLSAFYTLLHRYADQEDIAIGSPVAGRAEAGIENLIGCFINTLVLRVDLSGNPTFRALLGRVREMCLQAYLHQDLAFEKLVEVLNPARDLSRGPLFQVMFNSHLLPAAPLLPPAAALHIDPFEFDPGTAQLDLSVDVRERNGALVCLFNANSDLFDAPTIARMMGHYRTLLEGIVAEPEQRIGLLPLLTPAERQQILVEWNRPCTPLQPYPGDRSLAPCRPASGRRDGPGRRAQGPILREVRSEEGRRGLPQLFEEQAERTPEATAVVLGAHHLTYHELNARANQLAWHLLEQGAGPDVVIGLCAESSLETIVAILAILKAGAAYLPLEPDYPEARLAFMLRQATRGRDAPLLLTQERLLPKLDLPTARVTCFDVQWPLIAAHSQENPVAPILPDSLAYVLYTSGSTGTPKGVMISHGGLCHHAQWFRRTFALMPDDRVVQAARLSFDASVAEIFPALIAGAQVILVPEAAQHDPVALAALTLEQGVTILNSVPTLLRMLLEEPAFIASTQLRVVICGGEDVAAALTEQFLAQMGAQLYVLYGPTEGTVDATLWWCRREEGRADTQVRPYRARPDPGNGRERRQALVPIGRPIPHVQAYVLDRNLQLLPVGVRGEIYLGGAGLARGYFHRPDLTAASFVPHPFSPQPGARLYRTGDLGRCMPDGNLQFLGRIDDQVKIRGYRVELGEIESALQRHPAVAQAAVLAREDHNGDKRLVAYVVPRQGRSAMPAELRHDLRQVLPHYLLPDTFVTLESMPLTGSGKVDRNALPLPAASSISTAEGLAAPDTATEVAIAAVWQEALGVERIGRHDNFFDLGGHSLLALQAIARMEQALGVRISLRDLVLQTLAQLGASCDERLSQQAPARAARPGGDLINTIQQALKRLTRTEAS